MAENLTTLQLGQTLLHFAQKPRLVANHALHSLNDQRTAVPALLGGKPAEFLFQIGRQDHFHEFSV